MDVKSLISCASNFDKVFKEASCSVAKTPFKAIGLGGRGANTDQDALEAVKLDPAVLEAQVTVYTKEKSSDTDPGKNVVTDNQKVSEVPEEDSCPSPCPKSFEVMVKEHEAALQSLTPHQLDLLMNYADVLRRQRMVAQRQLECAFCKSNGKPLFWYTSHALKDWRGRVRCPVLRAFRCPRCGATGDRAHTIKYCPDNIETKSSCSRNSSL